MVSDRSTKIVGHRHSSSGDMILVVQEQDSTFSRLNLDINVQSDINFYST